MNLDLSLAAISRVDLPKLLEWRNDYRIWQWCRQNDLINELSHEAWFEWQAKDPATRMYKLLLKTSGAANVIGVCGLTSIDWQNRRAEFSLYIGPQFQRLGAGKMGLSLLLCHGFDNLGLNLIYGETFDGNPAAKMFEKLGFAKEGTRRNFYWRDGKYVDAHLYSLTREEWSELRNGPSSNSAGADGPKRVADPADSVAKHVPGDPSEPPVAAEGAISITKVKTRKKTASRE
jgi:RimJ/RimL family protein N-acetyltransferase